ncbi:hypothetical protein [Actibacterium sp. D379-3]
MTDKKSPRKMPDTGSSDDESSSDASAFRTMQMPDLTETAVTSFASDRDALLGEDIPDPALPQTEEEYISRDPFSADYVDFRLHEAEAKQGDIHRVNAKLRADLLAAPHLMEKPAESGNRGAAAVWRSLRDILREESHEIIDNSGLEELLMLKRELEARKAVVEAVNAGIGNQLKRLEQRLTAFDDAKKAAPPKDSAGKEKG